MASPRLSRLAFILVFVAMAVTSLLRNDVFRGTTNVINWDGYGYYAYLPAIFVYGDVTDYAFAEDHFARYEISNDIYQLMEVENGSRFPIYNIGLAIVWAPAFLLAHGFVLTTGVAPADGMSYPYQLSVVLTSLIVIFLGLFFLRRFLLAHFNDLTTALTIFGVGLATNLFYYVTEGPDVTHAYLFAGYALFLFCFDRLVKAGDGTRAKWIIRCGLLAGLMCLVRSSEIVLFAIPAFYGLKDPTTLRRNFWRTLPIFLLALMVFGIQLIYYKIGTGGWFQDGYAGLGFDWLSPHLLEGFFGYRRGWLVYTPLMIFALLGIFWLPRPWRLPITIFLIGNSYILFSWHIWWYGNTFGSRPVVQSYALLALPLGAFLAALLGADAGAKSPVPGLRPGPPKGEDDEASFRTNSTSASDDNEQVTIIKPKAIREGSPLFRGAGPGERFPGVRTLLILLPLLAFTALNLFQHWQYNQRILPLDFVNKTYYWEVFGKTKLNRKDYVYRDTNEKLPSRRFVGTPLLSVDTLVSIPPKSGREFTNLSEHKFRETTATDTWLRASMKFSYFGDSYDKWKFPSVVTEHRRGSEVLKWVQVKIPPIVETPELDSLTFSVSLPDLRAGDVVKQYLWNLSEDSMAVRAYRAEVLR